MWKSDNAVKLLLSSQLRVGFQGLNWGRQTCAFPGELLCSPLFSYVGGLAFVLRLSSLLTPKHYNLR